ncbi:MAG: sugar ABC transporter substrate-binding protein [Anaerolineae bacterium]|nr:sugar ABC transporter substrate-binding protein [Anaerolineae bacterium]
MSRKMLLIMLALVLALPGFSAGAQGGCEEVVTIRVDDWSSGDRVEYMHQVVDAFEEEYPCIKVELVPNIGDDQNTRRLTWLATGDAPDLMAIPPEWGALYVLSSEDGAYIDLLPYIEGENGLNVEEEFFPAVYEQGFYGDKLLGLPKDYSISAFYINTALFDAAGIPYPQAGWTWDDVLDIALELTLDANGNNAASPDFDPNNVVQWGIDIVNDGWWRAFQSYMLAWGTHTISEDGTTTVGYLNSEAAVDALSFYRDLVFVHHVAPSGTVIGATEGGRLQMFQDGKIAIGLTFHGPWWQDVLNATPNLEWAVVPLPAGPAGRGSAVMWLGWGITAQSEHPDEAWEVLKWLTTEPGQRVFALKALSASPAVSEEMQRIDDPYWGVFIEEAQHLKPLDDQRNAFYGPCVATPAGDLMKRLLADGGDALDIQAELDALAAAADACLIESLEEAGQS